MYVRKWKGLLEINVNWWGHGATLSRNTVPLKTTIMLIRSFPGLSTDYLANFMQNDDENHFVLTRTAGTILLKESESRCKKVLLSISIFQYERDFTLTSHFNTWFKAGDSLNKCALLNVKYSI